MLEVNRIRLATLVAEKRSRCLERPGNVAFNLSLDEIARGNKLSLDEGDLEPANLLLRSMARHHEEMLPIHVRSCPFLDVTIRQRAHDHSAFFIFATVAVFNA